MCLGEKSFTGGGRVNRLRQGLLLCSSHHPPAVAVALGCPRPSQDEGPWNLPTIATRKGDLETTLF